MGKIKRAAGRMCLKARFKEPAKNYGSQEVLTGMKNLKIILLSLCLFMICGCRKAMTPDYETAEETDVQETVTDNKPFQYKHDPRDNPKAMEDIIEDPDAVYGFAPDPNSKRLGTYAEYDWSDEAFVAKAQEERREYQKEMDTMTDIVYNMRYNEADTEAIARAVSAERNRLRLESNEDDPDALAKVKQSNLETYGNEEGPTPEQLYEKYGSWALVLQKAFSPNLGMDVICGLYDENYQLYIELGIVEEK